MKTVRIKSKLIEQRSIFTKLLAGYLSDLPVLLIGEKGTGKTLAVDEFSSHFNLKKWYLQLGYDTTKSEILGNINLKKLLIEKEFERVGGIHEGEVILLDEVDKANSFVRNLFLSVINERKLFNGANVVSISPKLIVGTSNKNIEEFEEEDAPFLDRFVIKHTVSKVDNLKLLQNEKESEEYIFFISDTPNEIIYKLTLNFLLNQQDIINNISNRTAYYIPKLISTYSRICSPLEVLTYIADVFPVNSKTLIIDRVLKVALFKALSAIYLLKVYGVELSDWDRETFKQLKSDEITLLEDFAQEKLETLLEKKNGKQKT